MVIDTSTLLKDIESLEGLDWFSGHNHTDASNIRLLDSINKVKTLIDTAVEKGLKGIAITDHECLSNHVEAIKYVKEGKENGTISKDFKLALGNEIYLCDANQIEEAKENNGLLPSLGENVKMRYPHFILIAKDKIGFRALCKLSTLAWENSFYSRGMERVPTTYENFKKIISEYRGHLIGSTACLGGTLANLILDKKYTEATKFVNEMRDLFGEENFFIEIQPSYGEEQIEFNNYALMLSDATKIPAIITTDSHYATADKAEIHATYLNSKDGDREVSSFYASTYLMSVNELKEYFANLKYETFKNLLDNSMKVYNLVEEYDLFVPTQIPEAKLTIDLDYAKIFDSVDGYEYIDIFKKSDAKSDKQLLALIAKGMQIRNLDYTKEHLERIDHELGIIQKISERLNQKLSSYYVLAKDTVDIMWLVSLVGPGRGSATGFFINYLLEITMVNPLTYNLPAWRHLHESRPELPDIDIDSESAQRGNILELVKQKYGHRHVLSIATFKTEGTRSALHTARRGLEKKSFLEKQMGLSNPFEFSMTENEVKYISSLATISVNDAVKAYEESKDAKLLIDELNKYPKLLETMLEIEGLICGRGIHASGVYIFTKDYDEVNAMMKAPNGLPTTQFSMQDSDYQGGLKLDFLTITTLDRVRASINELIKYGKIEEQSTLKETYKKYFDPTVLEFEDPKMWQLLYEGKITSAFQYETLVGSRALLKIRPHSFNELQAGNSLMRLSCEGEQPIDKFIKHKHNIELWYKEMSEEYQLTSEEIKILEKWLLPTYGIADTQESVMELSMDPHIANFDMAKASKLRKSIAKKSAKLAEEARIMFYEEGEKVGTRKNLLDYVWQKCIIPQLGYSFSRNHTCPYTMILMTQMNIAHRYGTIYWQVGCFQADPGSAAGTLAEMPKGLVVPPDINKAMTEFVIDGDKVVYSIANITSINREMTEAIIENRPYTSFKDFYDRIIATRIVTPAKGINLIKAGCFDSLEPNRYKLMIDYVKQITPIKSKLTTASVSTVAKAGIVPSIYENEAKIYQAKRAICNKKNATIINEKECFKIPKEYEDYMLMIAPGFFNLVTTQDGNLAIYGSERVGFDAYIAKKCTEFLNWFKSQDCLDKLNQKALIDSWNNYCGNKSIDMWEFESLGFFLRGHELDNIPYEAYLPTISNFNQLEEKSDRNLIKTIAGVVCGMNKTRNLIILNTQYGMVTVKYPKYSFAHYTKPSDKDSHWGTNGTVLVVSGYRNENVFVAKAKDKNSHSTIKIAAYNKEQCFFNLTR